MKLRSLADLRSALDDILSNLSPEKLRSPDPILFTYLADAYALRGIQPKPKVIALLNKHYAERGKFVPIYYTKFDLTDATGKFKPTGWTESVAIYLISAVHMYKAFRDLPGVEKYVSHVKEAVEWLVENQFPVGKAPEKEFRGGGWALGNKVPDEVGGVQSYSFSTYLALYALKYFRDSELSKEVKTADVTKNLLNALGWFYKNRVPNPSGPYWPISSEYTMVDEAEGDDGKTGTQGQLMRSEPLSTLYALEILSDLHEGNISFPDEPEYIKKLKDEYLDCLKKAATWIPDIIGESEYFTPYPFAPYYIPDPRIDVDELKDYSYSVLMLGAYLQLDSMDELKVDDVINARVNSLVEDIKARMKSDLSVCQGLAELVLYFPKHFGVVQASQQDDVVSGLSRIQSVLEEIRDILRQ